MRYLNPRWRKVIRDLWVNKSRTALIVLSIGVGIFAIGVVSGSQEVFLRELNRSFAAANPASGIIFTNGSFGDDLVQTIASLPEVEAADGRRQFTIRYKLSPEAEWQDLELRAIDDFDTLEIRKLWPQAGDWPPPDRQLLVERTSLDWMGAKIGDSIIVETPRGKERLMRIAGTVYDPGGPPTALLGRVNGYISRDTLVWLGVSGDYNQLNYVVADHKSDVKHIQAVGDVIRRKLEEDRLEIHFMHIPPPGEHPANDFVQPLLMILTGLGVLALALSGFLVINTIAAVLAQQTRQIGMMKAIGARQGQLIELYLAMVLGYGCLALLLALPLGVLGARAFTNFMAGFFNVDIKSFAVPPAVLVTQAVIGLLVPLLAAGYPVFAGTRLTVRVAISEYGLGQGQFGAGLIDRLLSRLRGLSRPLMISLRNTFRRKTRLILTLLTLTLAGAIFITVFSVRESLLTTLEAMLNYWSYDLHFVFEHSYRTAEIQRVAAQTAGVTGVETWGHDTVYRLRPDGHDSGSISLAAPEATTMMLQPTLIAGRWLRPTDTHALVVNSDFLHDEPDLHLGDEVILKFGRRKTYWQIVGVVQNNLMGATVYANYPYYARIAHQVGRASSAQVTTAAATTAEQLALLQDLEQQFERAGLRVSQARTVTSLRSTVVSGFNFLISFLLAMAVVLAIVGGLGLSGTMSINVLERGREIGVMRAIGASDGAVLQLVIVEGVLIGLLSWLAGVILALPLSKLLSDLVGLEMLQQPLDFAFSARGIGLWLVIAIVLAGLASLLPARGASRLTVREVLAYE
ncbi:MAG: ABC transporter permease [Chloroflexota bacterium]